MLPDPQSLFSLPLVQLLDQSSAPDAHLLTARMRSALAYPMLLREAMQLPQEDLVGRFERDADDLRAAVAVAGGGLTAWTEIIQTRMMAVAAELGRRRTGSDLDTPRQASIAARTALALWLADHHPDSDLMWYLGI